MSGDPNAFDETLREQALAQKLDSTRPGDEHYLQHVHGWFSDLFLSRLVINFTGKSAFSRYSACDRTRTATLDHTSYAREVRNQHWTVATLLCPI